MNALLKFTRVVDAINDQFGIIANWLVLFACLVSAGNAAVRYGINICSDTQFPEPAAQVAAQGAQLLLVSAQNMLRRPVAEQCKDLHHSLRADRARSPTHPPTFAASQTPRSNPIR